ncbi:MAG TPA: hypothetical protein VN903_35385 [Polyangia bacterium]|nr:hypothetical protein [Polyangia bacterium]
MAVWLSPPQRLRVAFVGWTAWTAFGILSFISWLTVWLVLRFGLVLTTIYCFMAMAALVWPVRRMILRRSSARMAELVRDGAPTMGVAIDDFADLDRQPDGALVSVVGWIRAREQLAEPVAGGPCIGLALACHQKYPGVLETLNDFDLVDEAGRAVMVQVAGARMLGAANTTLADGKARRLLIASLDLPIGAVATGWDAFVLRDGDPLMLVGFKQTTLDPAQTTLRAPPARASLASLPDKPLLLFPLAAERRPLSTI